MDNQNQNSPKSLADALGIRPVYEPEPETPIPANAEEFALAVLHSPEYRDSIKRRITLDELAPAVELRLYDMAYGKPTEHVEVKNIGPSLSTLTDQELYDRAQKIAQSEAKALLDTRQPTRMHGDSDDAVH